MHEPTREDMMDEIRSLSDANVHLQKTNELLADKVIEQVDRSADARDSIVRLRNKARRLADEVARLKADLEESKAKIRDTQMYEAAHGEGVLVGVECVVDKLLDTILKESEYASLLATLLKNREREAVRETTQSVEKTANVCCCQ